MLIFNITTPFDLSSPRCPKNDLASAYNFNVSKYACFKSGSKYPNYVSSIYMPN